MHKIYNSYKHDAIFHRQTRKTGEEGGKRYL